jgi:hypothetical protein
MAVDHDVVALETELAKIMVEGWQWDQGPGTEYFRQVELELAEAREAAKLPILNVTYSGPAYPLEEVPAPATSWLAEGVTWKTEHIGGAFQVVQRIGNGREVVGVLLHNGEGKSWLATDQSALKVA